MFPTSQDASDALTKAGVPHGQLIMHQKTNNVSYSDGSDVFVKVCRSGFDPEQLDTELKLANHYGPQLMMQPLHSEVLPVKDSFMTVWKYEKLEQFHPKTIDSSTTAKLADLLNQLHQLPLPPFPMGSMKDFSRMKDTIVRRVDFGRTHGMEARYTELMLRLSDTFLNETVDPDSFVLSHGDPHVGNAGLRVSTGEPTWFDFEAARLAPPEFDAATLRVNLLLLGENAEAWGTAKTFLSQNNLNPDLMEMFIRSRLISMTSYVMLLPESHDVARSRLDLLEPLLDGGNLPNSFPNERSA
jgi:hypothetical protein